jgi:subtilisin family serine protease
VRLAGLAMMFALSLSSAVSADADTTTTASASPPSGALFDEQWALRNTGQFGGTPGDDIDADQAWELAGRGNAAVLVGLVDSGVDFAQPSLEHANLYTQQAGADTPADCTQALYGCSFIGASGTPTDENGHGTATAGELVAGWEAGSYAGLAPESTLITARVLEASNHGTDASIAAGLDYVADHGARVVNVSIVGSRLPEVDAAIARHPETLFVAAAGNAAVSDDGSSASYPCADSAANVICVAASNPSDELTSFSNYGTTSVDLAAPGVNIGTLTFEGTSDTFYGTSFAAPLVTGTAALAFSLRPKATAGQVKQAILESVEKRPALSGKTATGGRLDTYRALQAILAKLPTPPPANSASPVVEGVAALGQTLSATAGEWSGDPSSTNVAWQRCDAEGGHCQLIEGANGSSYQPSEQDLGHTLRARVMAINSAGAEIAFSFTTRRVAASVALAEAQEAEEQAAERASEGTNVEQRSGSGEDPAVHTPPAPATGTRTSSQTGARAGAASSARIGDRLRATFVAERFRKVRVRVYSTSSLVQHLRAELSCGAQTITKPFALAASATDELLLRTTGHCARARVQIKGTDIAIVRSLRLP